MVSVCQFLPIILLRVTPSAKRNSYRVATPYYICTQGRGAAHLNPGLRKRNSVRVAKGAHHLLWTTKIHHRAHTICHNPLPRAAEGFLKQLQLCRSCDFPAQGCGRSSQPWVRAPTKLATVRVAISRRRYYTTGLYWWQSPAGVTPAAKRNTYSVATFFYLYPG